MTTKPLCLSPGRRRRAGDPFRSVVAYLRRRGETVIACIVVSPRPCRSCPTTRCRSTSSSPTGACPMAAVSTCCRRRSTGPAGPQSLIMMTGHFEESDLTPEAGKRRGVVVVNKPFSLGALYRLAGPGSGRQARRGCGNDLRSCCR